MKMLAEREDAVAPIPPVRGSVEVRVAVVRVAVEVRDARRIALIEPNARSIQNNIPITTHRILSGLYRIWKRDFPIILYQVSS